MTATNSLQILNENQQFSTQLSTYVSSTWNLASAGFNYNLVAVFGSQSTGKSTLLNKLFNTQFVCMSNDSRQQTTRGLWIAKSSITDNLLVMDVEGTDGRERGEDQDFERKSALFSLSVAQVIIVNMWENMVGLYNGANMGLLKTVFEVNLQLFQNEGSAKTLLLFVIRDFTGSTPLSALSTTLKVDLEKIWSGLSKPACKAASSINDYFDISFTALPHKVYASDMFDKAVDVLRDRFANKENPAYIFQASYSKQIPADGFSHFAASIWDKIVSNRDLDIPTQKHLLAQYRCDEISRQLLTTFNTESIRSLQDTIEGGGIVPTLGEIMETVVVNILSAFDTDASRYVEEVYQSKRAEFRVRVLGICKGLFTHHVRNLVRKGVSTVKGAVGSIDLADPNFKLRVDTMRDESIAAFRADINGSRAPLSSNDEWNVTEVEIEFVEAVETLCAARCKEALEKAITSLEKSVRHDIFEGVGGVLLECSKNYAPSISSPPKGDKGIWTSVVLEYKSLTVGATESTERLSVRVTGTVDAALAGAMLQSCIHALIDCLESECTEDKMVARLLRAFEAHFKYDAAGIPRMWMLGDDIDGTFAGAKDRAMGLLKIFDRVDVERSAFEAIGGQVSEMSIANHAPRQFLEDKDLILQTPLKLDNIMQRFARHSESAFVEAKRSVTPTTAQIPGWFVVLTVLLGWNEFYAVVSNPLYTFMLLVIAATAFAIKWMGMAGTVLAVGRAGVSEIVRQIGGGLRDTRGDSGSGRFGGGKGEEEIEMKKKD